VLDVADGCGVRVSRGLAAACVGSALIVEVSTVVGSPLGEPVGEGVASGTIS
jgi:hypothetical protein